MVLENSSKYSITLRRCKEDLIIQTCSITEKVPETQYKFQLSSLFTLLEDGKLTKIHPSLSKITCLDLSNCDLSELPKCVKILHLKNFNISNNKFTQVPSCLYNGLQTLESLDLSFNKLHHFDIEPDCVLNLKKLNLNNNCFENVPKWFLTFRCTNLEEFSYSENKAEHYEFLKNSFNLNFMKIKKLEVINSCLLDKDLPWIKCYRTLSYLDISNKSLINDKKNINKFKELDNLFVKPRWKEMKILRMNFLDISFLPKGIFWIESLKELHITNNFLSWFPNGMEFLVNLEILDVSNNQLVFIPKQISQLAQLKVILASKNQLEEIPAMPDNLEVLDLYDNYLAVVDNENLEHVKILDLELNYINLKDYHNVYYETYSSKRDKFRDIYTVKDRFSGIKIREEIYGSSQSESNSSESELDIEICAYNYNHHEKIEISDEDWDKEIVKTPVLKHPDVSLSDHEYDGEKEITSQKSFCKTTMVYIDCEDLMFIDAD